MRVFWGRQDVESGVTPRQTLTSIGLGAFTRPRRCVYAAYDAACTRFRSDSTDSSACEHDRFPSRANRAAGGP